MTLASPALRGLLGRFDPWTGRIEGARRSERRVSDLAGIFADEAAWRAASSNGNPLVYAVETVEPAEGEGDLHYGIGLIQPGRIGREYFMTRGHLHSWREAAELYVGLSGQGVMLLEDEASGESRMLPLGPGLLVYVPGKTGHRTVNVGGSPLTYLGIYPARAGHDYGAFAVRNFRFAIVEEEGQPRMVERRSVSGGRPE